MLISILLSFMFQERERRELVMWHLFSRDGDCDVVQDVGVFKRNKQSNVSDVVAFNKYWLLPLTVAINSEMKSAQIFISVHLFWLL